MWKCSHDYGEHGYIPITVMTTWSSISRTSKSQTRISLDSATGSYLIVGTTINMIHVYPFETWHVHKKSWETHTSQTVRSNITGLIEGKHETKARFWQLDFNVFLQQNHLSEEPPTDIDSKSMFMSKLSLDPLFPYIPMIHPNNHIHSYPIILNTPKETMGYEWTIMGLSGK